MSTKTNLVSRFLALLLFALGFVQALLGQTIATTQARVLGLQYDSATQSQLASWTFTLTSGNYGQLNFVSWEVDGSNVQTNYPPHCFDTYTYKAGLPSKHTIKAYLSYACGRYSNQVTVAAIGGPLSLAAKPYPNNPPTFANDHRDLTEPIYIQYFDYSHASPPTNSGCQQTQDGTASVTMSQLTGTTMSWSYGALRCPELVANSSANLSSITLQSESAATSPITVACHYSYTDPSDSSLSGSADDDTATTTNPAQAPATLINQISVHRPNDSSVYLPLTFQNWVTTQSDYVNSAGPDGQLYWAGTKYEMLLVDQFGDNMPGIWVQERFSSVPATITVNTDADYWTTEISVSPAIQSSYPGGVFEYDTTDYAWDTPVSSFSADHTYWAATKYIDLIHVPLGIPVGTYTITWMCSMYTHQVRKP